MVKESSSVEERLKSKSLYKVTLLLVKFIPIIIATAVFLNSILEYFYIECSVLNFLCGISVGTLILMYILSLVFKFCKWHRLIIHYITINWVISAYDYYVGIPISNKSLLILYLILTGIFLYLIIYYKLYEPHKKTSSTAT